MNFDGKPAKEWVWQDDGRYLWRASDDTDSDRVWWTASISRGTPRPLFDFTKLSEAVTDGAGAEPGNEPIPSVKAVDTDRKAALVVLNEDLYLYRIESNSATLLASRIDTDAGAMFQPRLSMDHLGRGQQSAHCRFRGNRGPDAHGNRVAHIAVRAPRLGVPGGDLWERQIPRILVESRFDACRFPRTGCIPGFRAHATELRVRGGRSPRLSLSPRRDAEPHRPARHR